MRYMTPGEADWYSGRTLEQSMAPLIEVVSQATEANWTAEHTGGGCFWIVTYLTDKLWEGPYVSLTGSEGPLTGNDTVAHVEATEHGWILGVYDGRYDDHSPNGDGEYVYHGPYATEELPLRAKELLDRLRKEVT